MTFENLLLERDGAVAVVTDQSSAGSQRAEQRRRSTSCAARCSQLKHDAGVRAVIITGAGEKSFVAGADINELAVQTPVSGTRARAARAARLRPDREPRQAGDRGHQRLRARRRLRAGDGVHAPDRRRHGAARPAGDQPRASFPATAARSGCRGSSARAWRSSCCSTGDQITAAEALRIGLVNRVVPAAELMAEAQTLAARAGGQGADRGAVHPRSGQPGPRDAARQGAVPRGDAVRPGRVAPTTCARARRRFSRSASRTFKGERW